MTGSRAPQGPDPSRRPAGTLLEVRRAVASSLALLLALSPLEGAYAQTRLSGSVASPATTVVPTVSPTLELSPAALTLTPTVTLAPSLAASVPVLTPLQPSVIQPAALKTVAPAASKPQAPEPRAERKERSAETQAAEEGRRFDGGKAGPEDKGTVAEGLSSQAAKELITLRAAVQRDARNVLKKEMGGDVGDGVLHRDVLRVAKRLVKAAGLPEEAAQVFIGNSFLPNAFTTITDSEAKFIETKSSVAKPFRVANVFLSLGLLRALSSEAELAFVIAHELNHNWKEHLKGFAGSHQMLGHFHEFEADFEALKLLASAGYDPREALDTLYKLDQAYEKLGKEYALFGRRDKGELAQALQRVQDVHPHADLRRANLLDHLDEALELYAPKPVPEKPVWMERRKSSARPSALDRFEARARKAAAVGTVEERLHALERFVEREKAKRALSADEKAVVEEAYRDVLKTKPEFEETRAIEISVGRSGAVAGKGISGELVTRQLELVSKPGDTLEDFLRATAGLGPDARRAGALRMMGRVKTRRELDAMFRALTKGAESFDLTQKDHGRDVAERLWRATYRVLTAELGRPAMPEEIVDELKAELSPSWLREYRSDLQLNIVGTAFERPERRSKKFTPSQLARRLADLDDARRESASATKSLLKGYTEWAALRYTEGKIEVKNDRVVHNYERWYVDGLTAPDKRDLLDLAENFQEGWRIPPALVRILRRDGLFDDYVLTLMDRLERDAVSVPAPELEKAVSRYAVRLQTVMRSALHGVRDLGETARVARLVWERARKTHDLVQQKGGRGLSDNPDVTSSGSYMGYSYTTKLSDELLQAIMRSVRVSVVRMNQAGERPDPATLGRLASVVRDIEGTLRMHPGERTVLQHAARLGKLLATPVDEKKAKELRKADLEYMRAFGSAISAATEEQIDYEPRWFRKAPPEHLRHIRATDLISLLLLTTDDRLPATTRLAAAALADKIHLLSASARAEDAEQALSIVGGHTIGRWLVEGAVRTAAEYGTLPSLNASLLRLNHLQPGFLNPDAEGKARRGRVFDEGAGFVRRNEPLRTLARQEHPFRAINVRWGHELMAALDARKLWPETTEDKLDLLDFMNANGEFSDALDQRVLDVATADPEGFRSWIARDEKRLKAWGADKTKPMETPFGKIMIPRAAPLRIVRNTAMRVKLFDLLPQADLKEKAPRRGLRETIDSYIKLWRAYRAARKVFSAKFLQSLRKEGSLEGKYYLILEEIDRLAHEDSKKTRERWDRGDFDPQERRTPALDGVLLPEAWKNALPHEKEDMLREKRVEFSAEAFLLVYQLYLAFAATQEPLLGLILENYPEPTRSRDELLERVMKARRLTPGALSFLEANKSYRQPNPVRMAEKQLLDQAITHLRRFKPEDRVDLILHMSGVAKVAPERARQLNKMFFRGDRGKFARDKVALRDISQLRSYMSLMHPKDRSMLVRAMFFGPDTLHQDPKAVQRLYEAIVLEGRGLPKFVEETLRAYFRALTDDEKAVLISNLAGATEADQALKGPKVIQVALKGMGVTGAKIAQVLATHRGLLPDEYADALEGFKDKAQDMVKMRAFELMRERLEKLAPEHGEPRVVALDDLLRLAEEALPDEGPALRRRLSKQVRFILAEEGREIRRVEYVGRELGSGSIKVVYKVTLADGRVWVVKLRAPGAKHRTQREFDIVETMVADLERSGTLDLPGVHQLIDEVRELVRAEMDFRDESEKERRVRANAVTERPWYARLIVGKAPYVPTPHPVYEGEDILVEEFVPVIRFADLPDRALLGASKRSVARASVDEGTFALLHDEWLEPDAHTGNRYARAGWLYKLFPRLVMIDLGQGKPSPLAHLKPLMRAGLALEGEDLRAAAAAMMPTLEPGAKGEAAVLERVIAGLGARPDAGIVERLMDGYLEAEKSGALVKPDYAALQKGFLIFAGYSRWLPKNYLYASLERAAATRMLKDGKISLWGLLRLQVRRLLLGRAATRGEMSALIDAL